MFGGMQKHIDEIDRPDPPYQLNDKGNYESEINTGDGSFENEKSRTAVNGDLSSSEAKR